MASGDAWQAGWNLGSGYAKERFAQKQGRANELWEGHLNELNTNIGNLQTKYSSLLGPKGEETPESLKTKYALTQAVQQRDALRNPSKRPGIGAKIGEALHLTRKPEAQSITVQSEPWSTPATSGAPVTLAAEPSYKQYQAVAPAPGGAVPAAQGGVTDPRLSAVAQAFPRLAPYLSNVVVQQGKKTDPNDDRGLEFYSPTHKQNPNPGKITLELFDQMQGPQLTSALGGDLLHYLGGYDYKAGKPVDPQYWAMKQAVLKARTPQQQVLDRRIYEEEKKKYPNTGTYEDWLQESRIDAYIRGYVTPELGGRYPDEWRKQGQYNAPAMKAAVEQIRKYVTTPGETAQPTAEAEPSRITPVTEQGVSGATLPSLEARVPALPAGRPTTVKGPALRPAQLREQAQRNQRVQQETGQLAAAAPLSPEQQAMLQVQIGNMNKDAALDWARKSGVSGEALQELAQHLSGLPIAAGNWTPITGRFANGQQVTLLRNSKDGSITYMDHQPVDEQLLAGFVIAPTAKPATSKFGMNVESYKQMHGIPANQPLTPEQMNFVEQQIALSSSAPSTNITNTLKQDYRGFLVPIQESNRRIPGFGVILKDPLGPVLETSGETPAAPVAAFGTPSAAGPNTAGLAATPSAAFVPKTPAEAKKLAQTRRAGAATSRPAGAGGVRVGQELFAGPNKEYQDTKKDYEASIDRMKTMDMNLANALKGDQQAMLSLVANHIGMTLGGQKGARINQAVWNEAVESSPWLARTAARFDGRGWLSGVTLAPEQMRQMVSLAHEKVDVLKQDLDRITQELSTPQGAAPTGGAQPSGAGAIPQGWK